MSAKILFETLQQANLVGASGAIYCELLNIKTPIRDNSVVGNIIQEWLQSFMKKHNILFRIPDNSQEFPDFYMHSTEDNKDLLEVKCFTKNPNFDVANFVAYCTSIRDNPYRLDADYLIFEYQPQNNSFSIKNVWLKKVWEICTNAERSAIKLQIKNGQIYNIRPATWYGKNVKFQPFKSRLEFVEALKKVLDTHSSADSLRKNWLDVVKKNYKLQTDLEL
jgi:hypothetical protein